MKRIALMLLVPSLAFARGLSIEADAPSLASNQIQMMLLMGLLALVPFAVMMLTSFSKIIVVLSLVRTAIGSQQAPPTMVLTGLAAVLTAHIMTPTLEQMWAMGQGAWTEKADAAQVLATGSTVMAPLREFLVKHGSPEERTRFVDLARELRPVEQSPEISEEDLSVVVPAFVITELKEAFVIGFIVFLPFLILDMLIANVLLALGMQTLSPSQVSLPFKILLFVAVDGWGLLARGLVLGYR